MALRPPVRLLLAVLTVLTSLLVGSGPLGPVPAAAQTGPYTLTYPDGLQLVGLTADVNASPDGSNGAVHFTATLDYQVRSAPQAFLLLFFFENDSPTATEDSNNGLTVQEGDGTATFDVTYRPATSVENVTLFAGLFKDDQTMVAWASTNPVSLASYPERVAFASAMAARANRDYAGALGRFSAAIDLRPSNGRFFYWRGDTRMRLNQYGDAVADFSRALDLMPGDRASLVGRGVAHLWTEEWPAAVADLTSVVDSQSQPDQFTAWALRGRGIAEAALERPEAAIADYRAYLSMVPAAADRSQVESWIAELGSARTTADG
jgi:tetratricopeptide (TPR) repeat protein